MGFMTAAAAIFAAEELPLVKISLVGEYRRSREITCGPLLHGVWSVFLAWNPQSDQNARQAQGKVYIPVVIASVPCFHSEI
jgi:hypothetical protein